jgi:hypothetical protein
MVINVVKAERTACDDTAICKDFLSWFIYLVNLIYQGLD